MNVIEEGPLQPNDLREGVVYRIVEVNPDGQITRYSDNYPGNLMWQGNNANGYIVFKTENGNEFYDIDLNAFMPGGHYQIYDKDAEILNNLDGGRRRRKRRQTKRGKSHRKQKKTRRH